MNIKINKVLALALVLVLSCFPYIACTSDDFLEVMDRERAKRVYQFPNTRLGIYWSSSIYEFFDNYGVEIDFRDGNVNAQLQTSSHYVRCVANTVDIVHVDQHHTYYFNVSDTGQYYTHLNGDDGFYQYDLPDMLFLNQKNGTLTDNVTGLIWTKCTMGDSGVMDSTDDCTGYHETYTWQDAIDACEDLDFGGRTDWKLPTFSELSSIVDYGSSNPAIK